MSMRLPADPEVWVRRVGALVVAAVAAYASYQHQRQFALHAGAGVGAAALWPLSVDGLLVLASTGLLRARRPAGAVVWSAFLLGIGVSLAANIAAAPALSWQSVLVAGWPPVSLLLAVELLGRRVSRERNETRADGPVAVSEMDREAVSAEERMWVYFQQERAAGRMPTGADLDRVAGTSNYGRAVLRRWRRTGRIPARECTSIRNGHVAGGGDMAVLPSVHGQEPDPRAAEPTSEAGGPRVVGEHD